MIRHRQKRKQTNEPVELDITSFLNLMIVLVPVLLITLVFSPVTILDLKIPATSEIDNLDESELQLEVTIRADQLVLSDTKGGVVKRILKQSEQHDFATLSVLLQEIKKRFPEKRNITLLAEADTDYQTIVATMDTLRSFKAVVVASVVEAELFPDISLGDAPEAPQTAMIEGGSE